MRRSRKRQLVLDKEAAQVRIDEDGFRNALLSLANQTRHCVTLFACVAGQCHPIARLCPDEQGQQPLSSEQG